MHFHHFAAENFGAVLTFGVLVLGKLPQWQRLRENTRHHTVLKGIRSALVYVYLSGAYEMEWKEVNIS